MLKEEALHRFFSGFGWQAYDENTVASDAELPYITYELATNDIGMPVFISAMLWDRSMSWERITKKAKDIAVELSTGGCTLPYDDGLLWIVQGSPFSQRVGDDDPAMRRIMLNFALEYISAY